MSRLTKAWIRASVAMTAFLGGFVVMAFGQWFTWRNIFSYGIYWPHPYAILGLLIMVMAIVWIAIDSSEFNKDESSPFRNF